MSKVWIPNRVISGDTFGKEDFDIARLKLVILKKNFNFISFYEALSNDPHSLILEFQLPDEPKDAYLKRLGELYAHDGPFFGGRAAQEYWGVVTSEILKLLYPGKDLDVYHPLITKGLPLLFYSREEFGLAHGMVEYKGKLCYRSNVGPTWFRLVDPMKL